jgi:hypothetical protein
MWRLLAIVAVLWPSRVSGLFDGPPLDTRLEALALGFAVPMLLWLEPAFLRRGPVRVLVATIVVIKIGATAGLQQEGWCLTFDPPKPMIRDSTGKPHAWDIRADWLADDPVCSAVMTRSYHDTRELPVWFYNMPPPGDTPHRGGYGFGEILVKERLSGYIDAPSEGTFELITGPATNAAVTINGLAIEPRASGHHEVRLPKGQHLLTVDAILLSKHWPIVAKWDGREMGSMWFPATTLHPASATDRIVRPFVRWMLPGLIGVLVLWWLASFVWAFPDRRLLIWSVSVSGAMSIVAIYLPSQAPQYATAALALALLVTVDDRMKDLRGAFMLIALPWLIYIAAANVDQIGRWTLYGEGNDNFHFQRYAYRVFMQHYWLEGGQPTFWNQPFKRWIVGALHMVFGESSVGQAYWDGAGVAIMAMFAYAVVAIRSSFRWGIAAAVLVFTFFLLSPSEEFVGFGLSEISAASFIYLAVFFAMRRGRWRDVAIAGLLAAIAFYTRLNNLPMAFAVAAFAVPLTLPASAFWRPRQWLPLVHWRVVIGISIALALAALLFAWRTWYYTGVFSVFYGTQREFLAVWKPGMSALDAAQAMVSSVMMILTATDPPAFTWTGLPLIVAAAVSLAALAGVPLIREAPAPVAALFLAGCVGALVTRGWGHEGRFSLHLFGAASALCMWLAAVVTREVANRFWYAPAHSPPRVIS